jgi:hypothetical protein
VIEEAGALVEVSEPEVFRWYGALQAVAVELPAEPLVFAPQHRLVIETDAGQSLAIGCGPTGASGMACARDEGPGLRVIGGAARAGVHARDLRGPPAAELRGGGGPRARAAARAGERPGAPERAPGPRGVAPRRAGAPDGVAVLDEVRLEAILAALQSLRAEGWTPVPPTASLRTLRVEGLRAGTGDTALAVDVYASTDPAQCVGHVPGQPQAARLAPETCVALLDDLLYDDPLRFWLGQARSAQLTADGGAAAMLRREGEAWSVESGETGLLAQLPGLAAFRSAGLRSGEPRGAAVLTAKIWRSGAAAVRVDLGPTIDGAPAWVRLVGQPWYYLAGEPARE